MSQAEERFMDSRHLMERQIRDFHESCQEIEIDNAGFAEDVIAAITEATDGAVVLEDWYG